MTLDQVILHTVVHHSLTSTYMPNFIDTEETSRGCTYGRTDGHLRPAVDGHQHRNLLAVTYTDKAMTDILTMSVSQRNFVVCSQCTSFNLQLLKNLVCSSVILVVDIFFSFSFSIISISVIVTVNGIKFYPLTE